MYYSCKFLSFFLFAKEVSGLCTLSLLPSFQRGFCSCQMVLWVLYPWRRKWQSIRAFLLGISHAKRSLVDYSPWGCRRGKLNLVRKQQHKFWSFSITGKMMTEWECRKVLELWNHFKHEVTHITSAYTALIHEFSKTWLDKYACNCLYELVCYT